MKLFLKLVSELHNFILFGIVFHSDAPENEKLVLKRSRFGQSYQSRCGASVGTDKKLLKEAQDF